MTEKVGRDSDWLSFARMLSNTCSKNSVDWLIYLAISVLSIYQNNLLKMDDENQIRELKGRDENVIEEYIERHFKALEDVLLETFPSMPQNSPHLTESQRNFIKQTQSFVNRQIEVLQEVQAKLDCSDLTLGTLNPVQSHGETVLEQNVVGDSNGNYGIDKMSPNASKSNKTTKKEATKKSVPKNLSKVTKHYQQKKNFIYKPPLTRNSRKLNGGCLKNPRKFYDCMLCSRSDYKELTLRRHYVQRHKIRFAANEPLPKNHKDVEPFLKCFICNKVVESPDELIMHKSLHVDPRFGQYKCGKCNQSFVLEKVMKNHYEACIP